jgi:hypothetical protein
MRLKTALMPMGSRAVTAMSTGLEIHQSPIQIIVPIARALLNPKQYCSKKVKSAQIKGPASKEYFLFN